MDESRELFKGISSVGENYTFTVTGQVYRGVEARKYRVNVDVGEKSYPGFLVLSDEENIRLRYDRWNILQKRGLGYFSTERCDLLQVGDSWGLLMEDLEAEGWDVFEYEGGLLEGSRVTIEASRWLHDHFVEINSNPIGINQYISELRDPQLKENFQRLYSFYIEELGRKSLPTMDPNLEADAQLLAKGLNDLGWDVYTDAYFILTRKAGHPEWPYKRRIIIGDLGSTVVEHQLGDHTHVMSFMADVLSAAYNVGVK